MQYKFDRIQSITLQLKLVPPTKSQLNRGSRQHIHAAVGHEIRGKDEANIWPAPAPNKENSNSKRIKTRNDE